MSAQFENTRNADRVREIVQAQHAQGNGAKLRESIDTVTENMYASLASGDYGRGDVRRVLLAELDRLEGNTSTDEEPAEDWDACAREGARNVLRDALERSALEHAEGSTVGASQDRTSAQVHARLLREHGRRVYLEDVDRDADPYAEGAQERLLERVESDGFAHGNVRTEYAEGYVFLAVVAERIRTDAERASDRAAEHGLDAEEVLEGFVRTAWADSWASAWDRATEDTGHEGWEPDERDAPNVSGCDILDVCPEEVPADFLDWARPIVRAVLLAVDVETLDAWGEYDGSPGYAGGFSIGSDLYLDAVGHGAGLADRDLPTVPRDLPIPGLPYSGGRPGTFGILEAPYITSRDLADANGEHATPTAREVLESGAVDTPAGKRSAEGAASALAGLARALVLQTIDADEFLEHADRIRGGFGVESIDLPGGGTFRYSNAGDTYAGTVGILDDDDGERVLATCWGSVLEAAEHAHTIRTGEQRCAYCGAWDLGGLDVDGLDVLDPRATREECGECGHAAE